MSDAQPSDVTRILGAIGDGDASATGDLLPLVYEELRRLARSMMEREAPGQTLQPTALVHDAYLRLMGPRPDEVSWSSRAHFFAAAAIAMRRILVDRARRRNRLRHGGGRRRVDLDDRVAAFDEDAIDFEVLDEALRRMETEDPRMSRVVMLRFFAGLSIDETATAMNVSPRTVKREWTCARAWLYRALKTDE